MFVIEKLIGDFDAKQEAYESRRDKWIDEGEDKHGYNYRSERDYARQYGQSPKDKVYKVVSKIPLILTVIIVSFLMTKFISVSVEKENQTNQAQQVQEK